MIGREEAVELIRDCVGQDMLSLRQCIRAGILWPETYDEFLDDLEERLRVNGYDEDTLGVDDLTEAMVSLVEEAANG